MKLKKDFSDFKTPSYEEWLKLAKLSLKDKPIEKLEKINSFGFKKKVIFVDELESNLGMPSSTKLLKNLNEADYISSKEVSSIGANAIQEIAYLLRCINSESANFLIYSSVNVFENIAKIRALRMLLNALVNEENLKEFSIYVSSSELNKSNLDVDNNILRLTLECFSSISGGADGIYLNGFNGTNSSFEKRISENIYHLSNEESYVNYVNDPGMGSYYIEEMTQDIAQKSWRQFLEYQELSDDDFQIKAKKEADQNFDKLQENLNKRTSKMIGVNIFANTNDNINDFHIGGQEKRLSQPYEVFRVHASNYFIKNQKEATINCLTFGELKDYKPRLDFIKDFFEVGAFKIHDFNFELIDDAVNTVLIENEPSYILLASDKIYAELASEFAKSIKSKNDSIELMIAGYPKDDANRFVEAGIDRFIHLKSNIYKELQSTWEKYS